MPEKTPLQQLADHGQSVWIDYLSRQLLHTGELERMMREDAVVGVTSNPTIFQKAISEGNAYDDQLRECLETLSDPKEIFLHLTRDDVSEACDLLRRVWDEGHGQDGYVSWEVDPNLAYDRDGTYEEAKRLHGLVDRPNLHVKIPATEPGLGAIDDMIALGKNINVTLIFSLERHKEVMEAYILGLDLGEEPRLPRHDVRRGADRAEHREHHAAGDDRGVPGSRQGRRHARIRDRRGARAPRGARRGRDRLRRRRPRPRAGGRAEVHRLVHRAFGGRALEEERARKRVSSRDAEIVRRIWARDASLWTSSGEEQWLGWLDEPARMRGEAAELVRFAEETMDGFDDVVLLGMGGSSLAPEVARRTF